MTQKIIRKGLSWKWSPKPPFLQQPPTSTCKGNFTPHINKLIDRGVVCLAPYQPCFPSRIFLVPKTTGGERLIIDLSSLNKYIRCPTFKMQDVTKIKSFIPKQAVFTSIDISDAFHHIPIHPRFQKYLAFTHNHQLFFFQGMPFGLNLGPLIFTKVITEVLKRVHTLKIPASVYIDDWLLWNTSPSQLQTHTFHHRLALSAGVHHKLGKIPTPTFKNHHLFRSFVERGRLYSCPKQSQHKQGLATGNDCSRKTLHQQEAIPNISRDAQLHRSFCAPRQIPSKTNHSLGTQIQSPKESLTPPKLSKPARMVDERSKLSLSGSNLSTSTTDNNLDGCIQYRMGRCVLPRENSLGRVVSGRGPIAYQRTGMSSSTQEPSALQSPSTVNCSHQDRQLCHCFSDKQTRVKQKPQAQPSTSPSHTIVCQASMVSNSQTYSGLSEFLGGFTVQEPHNTGRMDSDNQILQKSHTALPTRSGPLRTSWQCTTSDFRLCLSPSPSHSSGRSISKLESLGNSLPFSPNRSNASLPSKARKLSRKRSVHRPLPAVGRLVANIHHPLRRVRRNIRNFPASKGHKNLASRRDITKFSRLQLLTNIYTRKFSPLVATALTASHRTSTSVQYQNCWKDFQSWLNNHPVPRISKDTILKYLVHLGTERNLNPKTILVYRNALHLPLFHGFNINTKDQEFSLLSRAQFISNPPKQRFVPSWDPNLVLSMLELPHYRNSVASPTDLLAKTIFLVAPSYW